MTRFALSVLRFAAIVLPICELCDLGTITGLSVGVWGLLYFSKLARVCKKKPGKKATSPARLNIECKGRGWIE